MSELQVLSPAERKAVKLVYLIWKNIDFDGMKRSRLLGIWDEFQNKLKFASYSQTPEQFLETLSRKMGIQSLRYPELLAVLDQEVLLTIRQEPRKIVLFLRNLLDIEKKRIRTTEEKKEMNKYVESILNEFEKELEEILERRNSND